MNFCKFSSPIKLATGLNFFNCKSSPLSVIVLVDKLMKAGLLGQLTYAVHISLPASKRRRGGFGCEITQSGNDSELDQRIES